MESTTDATREGELVNFIGSESSSLPSHMMCREGTVQDLGEIRKPALVSRWQAYWDTA